MTRPRWSLKRYASEYETLCNAYHQVIKESLASTIAKNKEIAGLKKRLAFIERTRRIMGGQ